MEKTLEKLLFFILILYSSTVLSQNKVILINEYTNTKIESGDIFLRIVGEEILSVADTLFLYENDECFNSLTDGNYFIEADLFGYNTGSTKFSIKERIIIPQPIEIFITPILEIEMESVTVIAQPPKLQREGSQFVIKDIWLSSFAKGNNSMTLLKYTPLIHVGHDNKIALTGRDAVVYINGRPSNMTTDVLESYLSTLPAEELDRIEIRMLTGSRYSASGSAGIINIVLRSDKQPGYDITISPQIAYSNKRVSEGISLYTDYSKSRVRISAGGGFDENRYKFQTVDTYFFLDKQREEITINNQNYMSRSFDGFFTMDYVLSSRNTIGINFNVYGYGQDIQNDVTVDYLQSITEQYDSLTFGKYTSKPTRPSLSANTGINHVWSVDDGNTKISTQFYYILSNSLNNKNDNYSVYSGLTGGIQRKTEYKQRDKFSGDALAAKSVFEHAFNNELLFEAGTEISYSKTKSGSRYKEFRNGDYTLITDRSPVFNINESYTAAYAVLGYEFNSWDAELGLRYEYYHINAKDSREGNNIKRTDSHIFPSFSINYHPHDDHELSLEGEMGISHPPFRHYNPYKSYTSPNAYITGNPDIKPSLDYELLFNYSYKSDYRLMVNYMFSDNEYDRYTFPDSNGDIRTSYFNYGSSHYLSINAIVSKTLFNNILNFNLTLNANYMNYRGLINSFTVNVNRWSYLSIVRANVTLSKKQMINASVLYDWRSQTGTSSYYYSGSSHLSLDLTKRFKNGSSLVLTPSIVLPYKRWTKEENSAFFRYSVTKNQPYIRLRYSHKIGKRENLKSTNRRTKADIESRLRTQ